MVKLYEEGLLFVLKGAEEGAGSEKGGKWL